MEIATEGSAFGPWLCWRSCSSDVSVATPEGRPKPPKPPLGLARPTKSGGGGRRIHFIFYFILFAPGYLAKKNKMVAQENRAGGGTRTNLSPFSPLSGSVAGEGLLIGGVPVGRTG